MQEVHSALDQAEPVLTPRQDRIEKAILAALRTGAPRSTLREHVRGLAQLLRMQGYAAERAATLLDTLAGRAAPFMSSSDAQAAGDTPADRLGMMQRWCAAEFSRSD